jgi:hypothetical protein
LHEVGGLRRSPGSAAGRTFCQTAGVQQAFELLKLARVRIRGGNLAPADQACVATASVETAL